MALKFSDFATTWITQAIAADAASMEVDDGSAFPTLAVGDHFYVVLEAGVGREIVKVVSRNRNVFGIERGQGDTVGRPFPAESLVDLRPVSVALEELQRSGGRNDVELAEFIRDTMAAAMRSSETVRVTHSDDNDTFTFEVIGSGSGTVPAAYQRRAGISIDGDVSAAELIAGTSSMSENIALPVWAAGNRYIGFWVAGQRAIGEIEIARENRRAQFDQSQLTVDGVAGTLYASKLPVTQVYSGLEATVR